ncbi:MAG: hypothetical protein ACLGI6_06895 [Gammaproteobacteria bacterium]
MRMTHMLRQRAACVALCALGALGALGPVHAQSTDTPTAAPAPQTNASTDQNVPAATARQQAAEIARGDPARWSQPDASSAARERTLRKEIGAALQEAQGACRSRPSAERAACMKQARDTYRQEMAGLRAQLSASE